METSNFEDTDTQISNMLFYYCDTGHVTDLKHETLGLI